MIFIIFALILLAFSMSNSLLVKLNTIPSPLPPNYQIVYAYSNYTTILSFTINAFNTYERVDSSYRFCIEPCSLMEYPNEKICKDIDQFNSYEYRYINFYTKFKKEGFCNLKVEVDDKTFDFLILVIKPLKIRVKASKIGDLDSYLHLKINSNQYLKDCYVYITSKYLAIDQIPIYLDKIEGEKEIYVKIRVLNPSSIIPLNITFICKNRYGILLNQTVFTYTSFDYSNLAINNKVFYNLSKKLYIGRLNEISFKFYSNKVLDMVCFMVNSTKYIKFKENRLCFSNSKNLTVRFYGYIDKDYDKDKITIPVYYFYIYKTEKKEGIIFLTFNTEYKKFNLDVKVELEYKKCKPLYKDLILCPLDVYVYNLDDRDIKNVIIYVQDKKYILQKIDKEDYDYITAEYLINVSSLESFEKEINVRVCVKDKCYLFSNKVYIPLYEIKKGSNKIGYLLFFAVVLVIFYLKRKFIQKVISKLIKRS